MIPPPVYPLTAVGQDPVTIARELISAGAKWVQIRDKGYHSDRELLAQLEQIQDEAAEVGARVILNDRVDLVRLAGLAGVHLGQQDIPVCRARELLGAGAIIGLSTHNQEQFAVALEESVDYVAIGPIFPTSSKPDPDPVLGLKFLREARKRSELPIVAIGGINPARAREIWNIGVESVAVLSDIVQHESPKLRLKEYLSLAEEIF